MNNKKFCFILFSLLIITINIFPQTATIEEVKNVAKNFYCFQNNIDTSIINYTNLSPEIVYTKRIDNKNIYYVVNRYVLECTP